GCLRLALPRAPHDELSVEFQKAEPKEALRVDVRECSDQGRDRREGEKYPQLIPQGGWCRQTQLGGNPPGRVCCPKVSLTTNPKVAVRRWSTGYGFQRPTVAIIAVSASRATRYCLDRA